MKNSKASPLKINLSKYGPPCVHYVKVRSTVHGPLTHAHSHEMESKESLESPSDIFRDKLSTIRSKHLEKPYPTKNISKSHPEFSHPYVSIPTFEYYFSHIDEITSRTWAFRFRQIQQIIKNTHIKLPWDVPSTISSDEKNARSNDFLRKKIQFDFSEVPRKNARLEHKNLNQLIYTKRDDSYELIETPYYLSKDLHRCNLDREGRSLKRFLQNFDNGSCQGAVLFTANIGCFDEIVYTSDGQQRVSILGNGGRYTVHNLPPQMWTVPPR